MNIIAKPQDALSIVKAFLGTRSDGDLDTAMSYLSSNCEFNSTTGPLPGSSFKGADADRKAIAPLVSPDATLSINVTEYYATETSVTLTWKSIDSATDVNSTMIGIDLFTVKDNLIQCKDGYRKVYS